MPAIQARKKRLIADFLSYRTQGLKHGKFDFIRGWASFDDPHTLSVKSEGGTKKITSAMYSVIM